MIVTPSRICNFAITEFFAECECFWEIAEYSELAQNHGMFTKSAVQAILLYFTMEYAA